MYKKILLVNCLILFQLLLIASERNEVLGINKEEVTSILDTGHQVQVWKILPPYNKQGRYKVSIKHALKGEKGAFYFIAFTDSNNDGIPDKEIGRSNKKVSTKDGMWSEWEFDVNSDSIFVGNCWNHKDEQVYYEMKKDPSGYQGLSKRVYYSRKFNGIPKRKAGPPRLTNIKVSLLKEKEVSKPISFIKTEKSPIPEELCIIPPKQGEFLEMWRGLRKLKGIFIPVFGLESLDKALKEKGIGNVRDEDFKQKYLYIEQETPQGKFNFHSVYTDSRLFKENTPFQERDPVKFLEFALYDKNADGVYFNPISRVCDKIKPGQPYGTNSIGVAEIIGFLKVDPNFEKKSIPYHQMALEALSKKEYFQVLFFWAMSYRHGKQNDDWKKAEIAKLRAYHELDFPGSRERAKSELKWFIDTHGETEETKSFQEDISKKIL